MLRTARIVLWALVAVAVAGAAVLLLRGSREPQPAGQLALREVGGPFTLVGGDGRPFPSTRLAGKPHVIFFGFTNCPDVCPNTLGRLVKLRGQLGAAGEDLQIVFVTVDPERDGPKEVGAYSGLFGAPVIGLTGSPAQIARVKQAYGVFSEKVPDGSGGYSVDHSATALLFGRDGKFVATIAPEEGDPPALDKLRRITAGT